MFLLAGHFTIWSGDTPSATSAEAVITLKVEPGGYLPSSARLKPPWLLTTASISPVEGRSATSEAGLSVVSSAAAAARCTDRSSVVVSGRPDAARREATVLIVFPARSTRTPLVAGVPVSRPAY